MTITIDAFTAFVFFCIGALAGALVGVGWAVSRFCRLRVRPTHHEVWRD